jgi:NADH-quinone oxidoreductase subunit N
MLAYSSVAHAGYLLMGIVTGTAAGHQAITFYLTAYTFMQVGAFVVVSVLERENDGHLEFSDYAGLAKTHPTLAFLMAMFMFSLAGIPPFAGFFGKYMLFVSAIDSGFTWLTIVAVISSVISVYFYLGLVVKMYFSEPAGTPSEARAGTASLSLGIAAAFTVLLGLVPAMLQSLLGAIH